MGLKVVEANVADLHCYERNPRRIRAERLEASKRSLLEDREMLQVRPLIALPDGRVICGNQRLLAARQLGWRTIATAYVDLDEARARLWVVRDNNGFGEWDETLPAFLAELARDGVDLELSGFSAGDLERFIRQASRSVRDPDDAPPLPAKPKSKLGELYVLGPHRLVCGDATDPNVVAELLAGEQPKLCVTDPPYGVSYDPAWRRQAAEQGHLAYAARRVGEVANDDQVDWRAAWRLVPSDVLYCWHAGRHASVVQAGIETAGFEIRSQIIWAKPHFPISRGHYHWRHEPCWYAVRKGAGAGWVGDRKQTTVWEISLDGNVEGGHSTQKPVECMARAIRNHSGDVYEPFAGTGSTLIAAEMLGRRCFAVEIEPGYVDVCRQRYADFSGQTGCAP